MFTHFQIHAARWLRLIALSGLLIALGYTAPPAPRTQSGVDLSRWPQEVAYALDTGRHSLGADAAQTERAFEQVVQAAPAPWLRLHFSAYELGLGSYMQITSLRDGGTQRLDAATLRLWNDHSAFFNGDTVRVELYVAPGDSEVFAQVDQLTLGKFGKPDWPLWPVDNGEAPLSLCGADNRVASTESRVGRLWGHTNGSCTAWLISNGAVLTAGHCVDLDPDGAGPQLPDGVPDLNGVMEFNVPPSDASGNVVMAAPQDQFPIDTNSFVFHFDGEGQGIGKDYGIFWVNPNTGTGERPHVGRGFYRLSQNVPANGATIRITGFGADTGTTNFTNQTDSGPYQGETTSGSQVWHSYQVDTMGGNSGSPILVTSNGFTIGIHTNAGCAADGTGANTGTSFNHAPLSSAVNVFPAANIRYVDNVTYPGSPADTGIIFAPYHTVGNAVTSVPAGGVVSIVEGTYTEGAQTISKALTLVAPVGDVVIR